MIVPRREVRGCGGRERMWVERSRVRVKTALRFTWRTWAGVSTEPCVCVCVCVEVGAGDAEKVGEEDEG